MHAYFKVLPRQSLAGNDMADTLSRLTMRTNSVLLPTRFTAVPTLFAFYSYYRMAITDARVLITAPKSGLLNLLQARVTSGTFDPHAGNIKFNTEIRIRTDRRNYMHRFTCVFVYTSVQ